MRILPTHPRQEPLPALHSFLDATRIGLVDPKFARRRLGIVVMGTVCTKSWRQTTPRIRSSEQERRLLVQKGSCRGPCRIRET